MIGNATFPYKPALSKANIKAIRTRSTKWTLLKEQYLPATNLCFGNLLQVRKPLISSWFNVSTTQLSIFVLFVSAWDLFEGVFSLWTSLKWCLTVLMLLLLIYDNLFKLRDPEIDSKYYQTLSIDSFNVIVLLKNHISFRKWLSGS